MLHIKPIVDTDAPDKVVALYGRIREAFKLDTTPLFFQYMGNFPDFLEYIWGSIEENLDRKSFWELTDETGRTSLNLFHQAYTPSTTAKELVKQLLTDNTSLPFIRSKVVSLSQTNAAIALLFVSMREAVKGWALSTKLMKDKFDDARFEQVTRSVEKEMETSLVSQPMGIEKATQTQQFDYMRFMVIVQSEVDDSLKKEAHLYSRLALEEFLVASHEKIEIDLSYRILADYAYNYHYFDELVYLLSESFPTVAANRVIVSSIGSILLGSSHSTPGVESTRARSTSPLTIREDS